MEVPAACVDRPLRIYPKIEETSVLPSTTEFYHNYVNKGKPLVLRGYAKRWPAYEKWTWENLAKMSGDIVVPVSMSCEEKEETTKVEMRLGDYLKQLSESGKPGADGSTVPYVKQVRHAHITKPESDLMDLLSYLILLELG